jgi:hypothetical protein
MFRNRTARNRQLYAEIENLYIPYHVFHDVIGATTRRRRVVDSVDETRVYFTAGGFSERYSSAIEASQMMPYHPPVRHEEVISKASRDREVIDRIGNMIKDWHRQGKINLVHELVGFIYAPANRGNGRFFTPDERERGKHILLGVIMKLNYTYDHYRACLDNIYER